MTMNQRESAPPLVQVSSYRSLDPRRLCVRLPVQRASRRLQTSHVLGLHVPHPLWIADAIDRPTRAASADGYIEITAERMHGSRRRCEAVVTDRLQKHLRLGDIR